MAGKERVSMAKTRIMLFARIGLILARTGGSALRRCASVCCRQTDIPSVSVCYEPHGGLTSRAGPGVRS